MAYKAKSACIMLATLLGLVDSDTVVHVCQLVPKKIDEKRLNEMSGRNGR